MTFSQTWKLRSSTTMNGVKETRAKFTTMVPKKWSVSGQSHSSTFHNMEFLVTWGHCMDHVETVSVCTSQVPWHQNSVILAQWLIHKARPTAPQCCEQHGHPQPGIRTVSFISGFDWYNLRELCIWSDWRLRLFGVVPVEVEVVSNTPMKKERTSSQPQAGRGWVLLPTPVVEAGALQLVPRQSTFGSVNAAVFSA